MPLALLLGLKKESIGACYSINRDSNLGLTTDIFGPDAPETKGTFAVYIVGSVIGTVFISILASVFQKIHGLYPLIQHVNILPIKILKRTIVQRFTNANHQVVIKV